MYHLRTQLAAQLQDPQGVLNKQFAWMEAARRAGLSGRLYFGAQMLQCIVGEITLDALTTTPNSLPHLPGASLRYHLCRWVGISIPRFFLTQPAMAADGSSSSDGSSGRGGVRLEGTLPGAVADRMLVVWQALGLQNLKEAAQERRYSIEAGGTMWSMWETLLLPHSVVLYYGFIAPFVLLWEQARSSCSRLAECASDGMQGLYKRIKVLTKHGPAFAEVWARGFTAAQVVISGLPSLRLSLAQCRQAKAWGRMFRRALHRRRYNRSQGSVHGTAHHSMPASKKSSRDPTQSRIILYSRMAAAVMQVAPFC